MDDKGSNADTVWPTDDVRGQYADYVQLHASRTNDAYLHSGLHYDAFARFLNSYKSASRINNKTSFPHVVVKTITKDTLSTVTLQQPRAQPLVQNSEDDTKGHLIFIRGYTSPTWLHQLCEQTSAHPEFFRRHLNFIEKKEFFDLPSLPSASREILRLRITTICNRSVPLTSLEIQANRKEEHSFIESHHQRLGQFGEPGDSIVRSYAEHNELTYSIGQDVSCFVRRTGSGWTGLVWLDVGADLYQRPPGFWFGSESRAATGAHTCLPVIQHRTKIGRLDPDTDPEPIGKVSRLCQSAALLPFQYGDGLDRSRMLSDPIYAFSDVIAFAAASEVQFLNMMTTHIERDLRNCENDMEGSLANTNHNKVVLDDHVRYSRETLRFLRAKCADRKRTAPPSSKPQTNADDSLILLREDYEYLVSETESLIRRCVEGGNLILSTSQLDESRKAAQQSRRVGKLTLLAFFFVPMSFVGTFFGMNFEEFGQGQLRLWIGVATMAVCLLIAGVVCFWGELQSRWKTVAKNLG